MDKGDLYEVVKVTEEVERFRSQTDKSPPKKKRSKQHQTQSTEKPKKPRSAYLLYYFDVHQVMQQQVPLLPQSEINKRISESWRRLSVAEKSFYFEKAKLEKEGSHSASPSPSKELPGFRKILPRANYFVLAKGGSPGSQPEESEPDVHRESWEGAAGADLAPVTVKVQCSSLEQSEVEAYPQAITVEEVAEESAAASHSETHGILPFPSFAILPNIESSPCSISGSNFLEETAQVVALIPAPNLLTQSSLGSVTTVAPVMMMTSIEQTPKPSYSMPMKTYTRRGRGKCSNPKCSFVYVTRHKPPKCPECGQHLGGKWIPMSERNITMPICEYRKMMEEMKKSKTSKSEKVKKRTKSLGKWATPGGSSGTAKEQLKAKNDKASQDKVIVQKKPVRPILPAYYNKTSAMFKIVTVASSNGKVASSNGSSTSVPKQTLTGLKPSTLKQLGQSAPTEAEKQVAPASAGGSTTVSSPNRKMNIVPVVPLKQRTVTTFNLGLPTSRGRGWCRNPSCDYMYKNRHKPPRCPKCGLSLNQKDTKSTKSEKLLDPYKPLTAAQKDVQRQSTLHLLQRSLQFAESEADLQETLNLIQELNNFRMILVHQSDAEPEDGVETETLFESGWPHFFESSATHCSLCNGSLFKGGEITVAPQVDCWLLTETLMLRVSLQLKVCLNLKCLALHSFTDIHSGLFNIGNKVLVTIDLFLKVRASLKLGLTPTQAVEALLNHVPNHSFHTLNAEEIGEIEELLQNGYWAFECLTVRDYNDMICGICGVAPKIEISQRQNNLLSLENVEFIWPESSESDEVLVDDFWLTMESEALEQAVFPSDAPIIRVDASIIAPFIPPLMRSATVINTEKSKVLTDKPQWDPSVLVRLIHDGRLRLDRLEEHSEEELRTALDKCGADVTQGTTKDELVVSVLSLYTQVHNGLTTAPGISAQFTAGKLSKVCPHKVLCGSKCLIRSETARDHIDLLLSSRYWPPVYVSDCAQQVALCADMQYPDLATQMWGRNQGCFCDPFEKPEIVSCTELQELQDQPHSVDLDENLHIHPITRSVSRWLLHPPDEQASVSPPSLQHHSFHLCKDLEPYTDILSEFETKKAPQTEETNSAGKTGPDNPPVLFNNTACYYLYNRLVDFLTSRDIVNRQINEVLQSCQPGEVVIRDALYRLGVAKIDAQKDEEVVEAAEEAPLVSPE